MQNQSVAPEFPTSCGGSSPTFPLVIAEWPRNSYEVVRVAIDRYSGRNTLNIRVWYREGGVLKPSRSGLTLGLRHLPLFVDAIARAQNVVDELQLDRGARGEP